jgi:hypothetical protein
MAHSSLISLFSPSDRRRLAHTKSSGRPSHVSDSTALTSIPLYRWSQADMFIHLFRISSSSARYTTLCLAKVLQKKRRDLLPRWMWGLKLDGLNTTGCKGEQVRPVPLLVMYPRFYLPHRHTDLNLLPCLNPRRSTSLMSSRLSKTASISSTS